MPLIEKYFVSRTCMAGISKENGEHVQQLGKVRCTCMAVRLIVHVGS